MAGVDKMILRGVDMWKGEYFKRKGQNTSVLSNTVIHFLPKSEKTDDWKASVADYYEHIGLTKVAQNYNSIIKNRWISSGVLDINDYKKVKNTNQYEVFNKSGITLDAPLEDDGGMEFYPLVPNLVNLFTGYQLKRNNKVTFSLIDEFSKAELFDIKDQIFKDALKGMLLEMRDASINGEPVDGKAQQEKLIEAQLKFKNYKDVAVEWANRVHKINYEKFNIRNMMKQAFKESYLNSSKVIFHINMLKDKFHVEHIDEAFAFNGSVPNSVYITDSDYIGWFKWMNIGELLDNFGKILTQEDIDRLKTVNTAIGRNNLNLISSFNNEVQDRTGQGGTSAVIGQEGYDATRPYNAQPNEPLDVARYKQELKNTTGIEFTNTTTVTLSNPDVNPDFTYGQDRIYRTMYLYLKSQRRIGWLTKIGRTGEIEFSDWINEDYIVTEQPIYNFAKLKDKTVETLVYGEHIDWEWVPDWRRFIVLSPNNTHSNFNNLGINLDKIYIDGNSLDFQFKNDKTPFGVQPPIVGIELKQRGVKAVSVVSLLKQDQVIYNICKNRVKQAIAQDRGLVLAYPTNLVSRWDSDDSDDGQIVKNYEDQIKKNKTLRLTYDKQYMQNAGGQMSAPTVLNLSTLDEALKYDQLAERIWYNALRTVGVTPQAMGEIKASEGVFNVQASQQISQVQTELIFDEFNTRLMPDLYQKMLEATQYYSTINKEFRITYLNEKDENTWLDITGLELLHKDFMCTPKYSFDNQEFTQLLKKMAFDNTLQESLLTRLKVVAEADENVTKVLTILEEAELQAQENASKAEQAKQAELKALQDHEQLLLDKELENSNIQKDLDRESKEYIAQLNILGGGLQTDSNTNTEIDSMENFKYILKQRELKAKEAQSISSLQLQQEIHQDNLSIERDKLLQKDRSDDKKLKQAVVNRNSSSDSSLDKKVLKK